MTAERETPPSLAPDAVADAAERLYETLVSLADLGLIDWSYVGDDARLLMVAARQWRDATIAA